MIAIAHSRLGHAAMMAPALLLLAAAPVEQTAPGAGVSTEADLPGGDAAPVTAKPPENAAGAGDVSLFPRRVIIDQRSRVGTVTLFNRGVTDGWYNIDLVDQAMAPNGDIRELKTPEETASAGVKPAREIVRYSPRRVFLKAGQAQAIRIMMRPLETVGDGEYRTHFRVAAEPDLAAGNSIEQLAGDAAKNQLSVRLVPVFGISIPVIVRRGATTAEAHLSQFRVDEKERAIHLTINRAGTRSVYGMVAVVAKGRKEPIAQLKGLGVYPEIDHRDVTIPRAPTGDATVYARGAALTVTYTDDDFSPGAVLARQDFAVP